MGYGQALAKGHELLGYYKDFATFKSIQNQYV